MIRNMGTQRAVRLGRGQLGTYICHAAAYLRYYQDRWESVYPEIDGRTAILATLYNQGELNPPHSNPVSNPFGDFAKENYYHVRDLLGLE